MARFGVFNRNDNSVTLVSRSLQEFSHSMSTTLPYGQITPIFYEEMLPNERMSVNVTNLLRSIPMKSPMLSHVKVITRFYAVPKRILWLGFEEYIDGVKDSQFALEEPFIVNFNSIDHCIVDRTDNDKWYLNLVKTYESKQDLYEDALELFPDLTDLGTVGIGFAPDDDAIGTSYRCHSLNRAIRIDSYNGFRRTSLMGYQFFPHELGDYFNAPLYTPSLASDKSGRFSAYPFAAYQLCYSYGYRKPNVQDRIDDIYGMTKYYSDAHNQLLSEFPPFFTFFQDAIYPFDNVTAVPLPAFALEYKEHVGEWLDNIYQGYNVKDSEHNYYDTDHALLQDTDSVLRTSWSNVEHFPLRGGANAVMQALNWADSGTPELKDSLISLTRLRYANWQSDRFNEANPWQQRGTEAQIPVVGTASFDGLSVSVTPSGTISSEFSSVGSDVAIPSMSLQTTLDVLDPGVGSVTFSPIHTKDFSSQGTVTDEKVSISPAITMPNGYTLDGPGNSIVTVPTSVHVPVNGAVTSTFTGSPSSVSLSAPVAVSGLYVSPSSFRFAMQLQKIKEMSARTDGRFKSFLSMFYGAKSRDARLDRPEFIGGSVQVLNINEVEQTSETANTPLGTLGGRGFSAKRSNTFDYRASEHTCIIGLLHIVPDSEYIGGLERTRHLTSPFDTPMPQFAGLSEQPIRMAELAFRPTSLSKLNQDLNDVTFGFEPRYNELRVKHSYATGAFRDYWNTTGSYEYYKPWLITRQFGYKPDVKFANNAYATFAKVDYVVPTLSDEFLSMKHSVDYSNFEVTDPQIMMPFMLDSFFNVRWVRVVPSRGIPRI